MQTIIRKEESKRILRKCKEELKIIREGFKKDSISTCREFEKDLNKIGRGLAQIWRRNQKEIQENSNEIRREIDEHFERF